MKPIRLDRLLSNLGYIESRKGAQKFINNNDVCVDGIPVTHVAQTVDPEMLAINDVPAGPLPGFVLMLNKPAGYECSHTGISSVYSLLPNQLLNRKPKVVSIGRLDKDTTGLLLFTDDGGLVQRLTSPKHHVEKVYDVILRDPLTGHEAGNFESGTLLLKGETKPLKSAQLSIHDEYHVSLTLTEGRYHQVKRMFAAVGNHVEELHRCRFGSLTLQDMPEGQWRYLSGDEIALLK